MNKIDQKDKQILFELDRNGRMPISLLAKRTRLSRDVVAYRMRQLETRGIITGYIPVIDFSKLGYQLVRLYIKLQNTTVAIEEKIVADFLEQDAVIVAYRTDGNYELAIGFLVKDLWDFQRACDEIFATHRAYVVQKHVSIFHDYVQYFRNYLVEENRRDYTELSTGSFIPYAHDQEDILLLYELTRNSRASLLALGTTLNMTASAVAYRMRNLEQHKVIVAYRALIDYHALGYSYYKVDCTLEDYTVIPTLHEYIRHHPNVIFRDVIIGGSDFEFDCELETQDDFYQLMEEMRMLVPEKIREYFYYKAIRIYKYSYFPKLLLQERAGI